MAARIARGLETDGLTARPHNATSGTELVPHDHDAVIVGASIHAGHHQREIVDWAKAHHATLSTMPSAFFRCA